MSVKQDGGKKKFAIGHGRRAAPYTDVHDWVALAIGHKEVGPPKGVKGPKKQVITEKPCNVCHSLYCKMKMHLNVKRGDVHVYPSKAALADMVGFTDPDSIDPHLDHLRRIGAIDWDVRASEYGTNLYLINDEPPVGYTGPVSLDDYYERKRAAHAAVRKAKADKAKATRQRKKVSDSELPLGGEDENVPGDPPVRDSGGVPGDPPVRVTGESPVRVPGDPPGKQHVLEQEELKQQQPQVGSAAKASAEGGKTELLVLTDAQIPKPENPGREVLDGLSGELRLPLSRQPSAKQQDELTGLLADLLACGWDGGFLVKKLAAFGPIDSTTKSVFGALKWRIKQLEGETPPAPHAAVVPRQQKPCPHGCHSGCITIDGGDRTRDVQCPHCRPQSFANQLARFGDPTVTTFEQLRERLTAVKAMA